MNIEYKKEALNYLNELNSKIIDLYDNGMTITDICETTGLHPMYVSGMLKQVFQIKRGRPLKVDAKDVIKDVNSGDYTSTEIADKYGISLNYLYIIKSKYKDEIHIVRKAPQWVLDVLEELKTKSQSELAREMQVSRQYISRIKKEWENIEK